MDNKELTRREALGAKKLNSDTIFDAASIFRELEEKADIKERDLVYFLGVSDKTLRNWKSLKESQPSKLLRLQRLQEIIESAVRSSIPKSQIRQLLVAPLDPKDKEQQSIIDVIKSEPETMFFSQMLSLLIANFQMRNTNNGHYILNEEEFERIVANLESETPSSSVQKAREAFLALKKKA